MVVGKATTSTSSRASSSRLPPAPMTLGTSTRFLLVVTRVPDRRMHSHSEYAYYKPSSWTSSKTSSPRSARSGRLEGQYLHPCSDTRRWSNRNACSGRLDLANLTPAENDQCKPSWAARILLASSVTKLLKRAAAVSAK